MRNDHLRRARAVLAGAPLLLLPALAAPAAADYDDAGETAGYDAAYSYIRVLDGSATLIQGAGYGEAAERTQAEINQPVLAGDRLWVAPGSRAEVLLSDRNLLRLDGESEAEFESLAFSPESGDRVTTLRLLRGNAQLVVTTDSLGDQLPRFDTPNATLYPQDFGVYRVTTDGGDWTEVVVRRAHYSRRKLNRYWRQTIIRFGTLRWHKIDIGETLANVGREFKVNSWFLVHIAKSGRFDSVGRIH